MKTEIKKPKISYLIDCLVLEEEIKHYTNEMLRTGWCLYNIEDYREQMHIMARKKIKELNELKQG